MPNLDTLILSSFSETKKVFDEFAGEPANIASIKAATIQMSDALKKGNAIFSCGNGGSLCDATHFAEELTGRFRENRRALKAMAINDPAHMSCVTNDFGGDQVFAKYIEAWGAPGDILLAISTSGQSKNIVNAVQMAKQKQMSVVGLLGKDGGQLKNLVDIPIIVKGKKWSDRIQEVHIKIIHILIEGIEASIFS
ncbi:MAG: phosphoheptose isomerase [Bdellovibrionales bacterium GWA2_49_15]|nr:MAG: phosphoheptose isomerase [Bdellovibrionales bacterium GWA2_49_15]HAZ11648.1 phosphoheptose isomerase [Bdellovibrionales bacterium]